MKNHAWSAESYQLASLDAASVLRVWWMRPEHGEPVNLALHFPMLKMMEVHGALIHTSLLLWMLRQC